MPNFMIIGAITTKVMIRASCSPPPPPPPPMTGGSKKPEMSDRVKNSRGDTFH